MKEMTQRLAFIGIFALSTVASAFPPANAAESAEKVKITNYGDGIQMTEYADRSGFEMDGGGARFVFDRKTLRVKMIDAKGSKQEVSFFQTETIQSTEIAQTTQVAKVTTQPAGLAAAVK